ncbi:OmpA family protein [Cognatiyoonia sp.]|uniref:OmpA family protein n=1 Tax=Cognatiyoonia sp. TaxID=2211652 RepID=UPI003F6969A0
MDWFQQTEAFGFLIYGHTDARASDEYNMDLSNRRANAVASIASIARDAGVRVVDVKVFGERMPKVAGYSAAAYRENRRVEV